MSYDHVETLKDAILNQAQRDRDRLTAEARTRAERIVAQAEEEVRGQRSQLAEQAAAKVVELKREAKGSARLEAQAIKVRKREALLDEVFKQVAEQLSEFDQRPDYEEVVINLIVDAVGHLGDAKSVVILADEAAAGILDEATLENLEEHTGRAMGLSDLLPQDDPDHHRLGVVVHSEDGRLRYNNTLQARLSRMRSVLRASTYRILMGAR